LNNDRTNRDNNNNNNNNNNDNDYKIELMVYDDHTIINNHTMIPQGFISVTTLFQLPPQKPTNLTAHFNKTVDYVDISWNVSNLATNYDLDLEEVGTIITFYGIKDSTFRLKSKSIQPGHHYKIGVTSTNDIYPTFVSQSTSEITLLIPPPSSIKVEDISISCDPKSKYQSRLKCNWKPVYGVSSYNIQLKPLDDSVSFVYIPFISSNTSENSCTLEDIPYDIDVSMTITPQNTENSLIKHNTVYYEYKTPPNAPPRIDIEIINSNQITIDDYIKIKCSWLKARNATYYLIKWKHMYDISLCGVIDMYEGTSVEIQIPGFLLLLLKSKYTKPNVIIFSVQSIDTNYRYGGFMEESLQI
jgi:hypothetical protein